MVHRPEKRGPRNCMSPIRFRHWAVRNRVVRTDEGIECFTCVVSRTQRLKLDASDPLGYDFSTMTGMKFQDLSSFTAADVRAAIERNDREELPLVPITVALLSPDLDLAMDVCIELAGSAVASVRGNALTSLGHLARRFRSLDERRVRPLIEAGLKDNESSVRALAKSAADEIHQFLHWKMDGHQYG